MVGLSDARNGLSMLVSPSNSSCLLRIPSKDEMPHNCPCFPASTTPCGKSIPGLGHNIVILCQSMGLVHKGGCTGH